MQPYLFWLIAGCVLIGIELVSGTFYMLILGIAFLFAALGAWLGLSDINQILLAGSIGVAGVLVLMKYRRHQARHTASTTQNLDIGQRVRVIQWLDQRHARVAYRGSEWDAELVQGHANAAILYIHDVRGSTLLLSERQPEGAPDAGNHGRFSDRHHHLRR
ncbi:NfeD family protein [Chitinivorax sp. B]|uniref:NfeD family protein n=1 Tax=Chitinivorax sp. B TaxID=2502235 RepID=UPI0014859754|nr:NfeD family protein [Chitinivorax sp. B]